MQKQLQRTEAFQWKKFLMDKELNINMAKVKITQVKSRIKTTTRQKRTLDALGLRRNNSTVELEITPQINGMINKVRHLVKVEES